MGWGPTSRKIEGPSAANGGERLVETHGTAHVVPPVAGAERLAREHLAAHGGYEGYFRGRRRQSFERGEQAVAHGIHLAAMECVVEVQNSEVGSARPFAGAPELLERFEGAAQSH